jgi:two-component system OmpR family response regulator
MDLLNIVIRASRTFLPGVECAARCDSRLKQATAAGIGSQWKLIRDDCCMGQRKRILYIDDETDLQWLVKHILESTGTFEVLVCGTGDEALCHVAGFAPDLVLLDVMMPGMDGFSILRELRARPMSAKLPVVFLTARPQLEDEYLRSGALGVINKPFEPSALVDQLRYFAEELVVA